MERLIKIIRFLEQGWRMAYYDPKRLTKDTKYVHQLDIITTNSRTRNIEEKAIQGLHSPPRRSVSFDRKDNKLYNKWYINPDHHFKKRTENPKNNKVFLNDDMYIYKNLHNDQFWNWMHPFQKSKLPPIRSIDNLEKVDGKILEGFKRYMNESNQSKRLPYIVDHILNNKKNKSISK